MILTWLRCGGEGDRGCLFKTVLVNSDSFVLARLILELDPEYTFF